ncbi:MAG: 2-oxo-4-hydroxy-4-carboxy-5-ureidoimidazoline decarboxylase [Gemmatimonadales bacterium]
MDWPAIDELNTLAGEAFVEALAPLFEGAPQLLQRLAAERPFASDEAMLAMAREVAASTPEPDLLQLLDAHPRIGVEPAAMSALSRREQGGEAVDEAQEDPRTAVAVAEELAALNEIYEARFGFRYVVFVAGRPRAEIVPLMEVALRNDREAELRRGVDEAIYIAADRLRRLRGVDPQPEQEDEG